MAIAHGGRSVGLVVAALGALGTPGIAFGASWTAPMTLGESDQAGGQISVAVNEFGAAVAAWTERAILSGGGPGVVQHAYRPPVGVFGVPVAMDPQAPDFPPGGDPPGFVRTPTDEALVSVGSAGTTVAVWNRDTGSAATLWEGGANALGTFVAREPVTTGFGHQAGFMPQLRMAAVGSTVLVGSRATTRVALRAGSPGAPWRFVNIGPNRDVAVAIDTPGRWGIAAWIDLNRRVRVRRIEVRAPFRVGPIRTIAVDGAMYGRQFPDIGVALDAKDRGVVAWRRMSGGRELVRATFLHPSGIPRSPGVRTVSPRGRRAGQFDVAMAANGNATIAWTRRDTRIGPETAKGPVFVARRSPAAPQWSAPSRISPGAGSIAFGPPSVAMAKTFTYVGWYNDPPGGDRIRVARRVNAGPWSQRVVATPGHPLGGTWPEVHARGSFAIIGWAEASSLCCMVYRAAVWQP